MKSLLLHNKKVKIHICTWSYKVVGYDSTQHISAISITILCHPSSPLHPPFVSPQFALLYAILWQDKQKWMLLHKNQYLQSSKPYLNSYLTNTIVCMGTCKIAGVGECWALEMSYFCHS